jgi:hypothetical protein
MSMEIVNGYVCRNCTDVEYAKKGVDPAHPKDGPNGVGKAERDKDADKAHAANGGQAPDRGPAVTFGGALAGLTAQQQASPSQAVTPAAYVPGSAVNLTA